MSALDSSHFPAALPGVQRGSGFVFADTLGLHAVAMTLDGEREPNLCFTLDLYHPSDSTSASGGFLTDVGRRRRSGGVVLDARDRWMTETAGRPGEIIVPRLRWARREEPRRDQDEPGSEQARPRPAHLSLAFDMFEARLEARPSDDLVREARPLHAFGLAKIMERRVDVAGEPEWTVFAPPQLEREKGPRQSYRNRPLVAPGHGGCARNSGLPWGQPVRLASARDQAPVHEPKMDRPAS